MNNLCYTSSSHLKIAEIHRYRIKYKLYDGSLEEFLEHGSKFVKGTPDKITVTITNTAPLSMRATGVLTGPYSLYVDLKKKKFDHKTKYFEKSDIPSFEPNLLPSQDIIMELYLNDLHEREIEWELDIISQALFTRNCKIFYKVDIEYHFNDKIYVPTTKTELELLKQNLSITKLDSQDIWNYFNSTKIQNIKSENQTKTHLVILTHGMMSNVTADMLFIAEQIKKANDNCHITGFTDNVCKTERGIRYQGIKNGDFIFKEINKIGVDNISSISLLGHSLGGLIQVFSIAYLFKKYPEVMYKLKMENFITLASPLLGVLNDNPKIFAKLLHLGIIGKSGQDLGLIPMMEYKNEPFLSVLLCAHTRNILRRFNKRTVYANSVNDGVVPLYTSSLLFIEFDDIRQKMKEKKESSTEKLEIVTEDYTTKETEKKRNKFLWKPLMKLSTLFAPNMSNEENSSVNKDTTEINPETEGIFELPKMSLFDTAQNVLLQPMPNMKYIIDPTTRDSTIIHDKVYTSEMVEDIILSNEYKKMIDIKVDDNTSESFQKEIEIAKKWHKNLSWRKVICAMDPDAHNNINVRRKFHNAYGWEVIDHLLHEHFVNTFAEDTKEVICEETDDVEDYYWLLNFEEESLIDGGVTGMIPTISDLVDRWYSKLKMTVGGDEGDQDELNRRMSEFSIEEQEILFNYIR
ncbi:related to Putative lipase ROG1 [Hanseniaspora guilliermondii]|uniref:Related to Putative lipase ROG1 n=1 Tax=Hanseniaspora guilliermondii TaxID=56406 RepID=A0A1L0CN93_9ASCO|nr:related to Putative lipase ROG1 [Hanseniaspora guilliermondii]